MEVINPFEGVWLKKLSNVLTDLDKLTKNKIKPGLEFNKHTGKKLLLLIVLRF